MPIYVYRCEQCGSEIERRQRFQDPPLTECDDCQGSLRRVLQPVGIIFRGSGFYSTDYKSGSAADAAEVKAEAAEVKAEATAAAGDAASKSESAPAATATADAKPSAPSTAPASSKND